jgi:parvulin-like peptidyl-prolyl isomerase
VRSHPSKIRFKRLICSFLRFIIGKKVFFDFAMLSTNPGNMNPIPFLTVDNQPIFLELALKYLDSAGVLETVIREIIRQHVIKQELQSPNRLDLNSEAIEQAVIDFRLDSHLVDSESFQVWLADEGLTYSGFRQKIAAQIQLKNLKNQLTSQQINEYFIDRQLFLDRVVLSRLVVENRDLAEELKTQILEEGANFEQIIREYSVAEDSIVNGMMGAISRGSLPDNFRAMVDSANPGDLLGPIEIDDLWYVVRLEQFLPATLDEQLQEELQDELFEQWLEAKIQEIDVNLQVEF